MGATDFRGRIAEGGEFDEEDGGVKRVRGNGHAEVE
jgi:hypothetical protein